MKGGFLIYLCPSASICGSNFLMEQDWEGTPVLPAIPARAMQVKQIFQQALTPAVGTPKSARASALAGSINSSPKQESPHHSPNNHEKLSPLENREIPQRSNPST
jgi:hypothetical protein